MSDMLWLELLALAGDEGTRNMTVEGKETAAEYERRIKGLVANREAREKQAQEDFMSKLEAADLSSEEGLQVAAEVLGNSIKDGVLKAMLSVASTVSAGIFKDSAGPAAGAEPSKETDEADFEALRAMAHAFMRPSGSSAGDERRLLRVRIIMWLGAIYLNTFVAANWTGPSIKIKFSPLSWHPDVQETDEVALKMCEICKLAMEEDSEIFYAGASLPHYLRAALTLLVSAQPPDGSIPPTHPWWCARAVGTQQRIIQGRSGSLHALLFQYLDEAESRVGECDEGASGREGGAGDYRGRLEVESALAYSAYFLDKQADEALVRAQEATGLDYCVTGAMGIRRVYQQNHLAQLICVAKSKGAVADGAGSGAGAGGGAGDGGGAGGDKKVGGGGKGGVTSIAEDGDGAAAEDDGYEKHFQAGVKVVSTNNECDILDAVKLDDDQGLEEQLPLKALDQAILLARCAWNRRNRANDATNTETQAALIHRVQMHPTNWIVFTTCLLSRCRLELNKAQTVDRACLQLQVLVDQFEDEEPGESARMAFIYNVPYPPRWGLKKELADSMMKVGMLKTAAQTYEAIGLIKEMVECYIAMDEEETAERIVKEQLEKRRTPYMLTVMGWLKKDVQWYQDAWDESGASFAMARRWHAQHLVQNGDFEGCIPLYLEALAISPMYPDSWFKLGCAAMRVENWDVAVKAFLRVVNLEPESYESWGNIGAVYMGREEYAGALHAFQEAIKLRNENWKMWENFLSAALQLRKIGAIMQAMTKLIGLKEKEIDVAVLALLVDEASQICEKKGKGEASHGDESFLRQMEALMKAAVARGPDTHQFWDVHASFSRSMGDTTMELECCRRVLRYSQTTGWQNSEQQFKHVVRALSMLTDAYMADGSKQSLFSAGSALSTSIKQAQNSFDGSEGMRILRGLQDKVKDAKESAAAAAANDDPMADYR